ncbi:hypothetical protein MTBBW1_2620010 [Desulfamplus magnetovallimortis]|uniref:Uncharacterized protein n=1 Tax=Desulfamplus magnetovallimortis TaxID=1246637 RepID=A0A1W1HF37_9BACT|nr:hypothetical protein MTBBW1_2620010 [Desulfamplus magnetovallimortis]
MDKINDTKVIHKSKGQISDTNLTFTEDTLKPKTIPDSTYKAKRLERDAPEQTT